MEIIETKEKKTAFSPFRFIILGFLGLVLLGALLLMLPISSKSGVVTPFNEALFTSTSAACVTGLIVHDTATYWSVFGQAIILVLIQIGGLGVITVSAMVVLILGKKITLKQRNTLQEAFAAHEVGGIVRLMLFILKGTAVFETLGVLSMLPVFCKDYGLRGIWLSVFHSVSAFCNAGFDILGTENAKFQSLTSYGSNAAINITVMLLIIIGGIGFLTWEDIFKKKFRFKQYRLQSKLILITTAFLIIAPALLFFICDYSKLGLKDRVLYSLFQSVTTRTAGFNTGDFSALKDYSRAVVIILMLIGGSTGSTAGGMKTTTFAVLILNLFSVFRRKNDTEIFGRRIDNSIVKNAATILMMYFTLFFVSALAISGLEGIPFATCLFETASAIGTVGLTLGITTSLGVISQIILIILMFLGRVGGLTLIFATFANSGIVTSKLPQEKITVG